MTQWACWREAFRMNEEEQAAAYRAELARFQEQRRRSSALVDDQAQAPVAQMTRKELRALVVGASFVGSLGVCALAVILLLLARLLF